METKICASCKEEKPISCFSRNRNEKDGYKRYCKSCVSNQTAAYREAHAEEVKERNRAAYWKSKEKADQRTAEQEKIGVRTCSVCGIEKPLSEFYKCGNGGYRSYCKKCANAKAHTYNEEHRDQIIESKRKYHKDHKAEIDAYNKEYYKNHSEEVKQRVRKWEEANPIWARESQTIATHKRLSRNLGLETDYTLEDWHMSKDFFKVDEQLQCAYCGTPIDDMTVTQDHIIARGVGGGYIPENIIPACESCNSSKLTFNLSEWYRKQPFYSKEREKRIIEYCEIARQYREGRKSSVPCNA